MNTLIQSGLIMNKQKAKTNIYSIYDRITLRIFFVTIFTWSLVGLLILIQYAIFMPAALLLTLIFDRKKKRIMNFVTKFFIKLFFISYITSDFKIDFDGLKKTKKPRIYMMNHASQFDTFLMYLLPGRTKVFVKENYLKLPFIGWTIKLMGNIYVKKRASIDDNADELVETGKKEIENGTTLLIFPEGTKSKDGNIGRFKTGGFRIAYESGAEIVPVVLDTWNSIRPGGGGWIRDDKIWMKILPPCQFEDYKNYDIRDFSKTLRYRMIEELLNIRKERKQTEKNYYRKTQKFEELDFEAGQKLQEYKQNKTGQ